jgi:hypothetical protein
MEAFVNAYSGAKRKRYQNAMDSLMENPITKRDAIVSGFVKAEKADAEAKICPAPRLIQCRNARFNIALGTYLRPMEHQLYRLKGKSGLLIFGKCLNSRERANLIRAKMARFKNPVVVSIDLHRMDAHTSPEQLRLEHGMYTHCNKEPELKRLLSQQIVNKGYTTNGVAYKTLGRKMSGEYNTASGNNYNMYLMVKGSMKFLLVTDYEPLIDGDDTLIICDASDVYKLEGGGIEEAFLLFGHEAKVERTVVEMENVIWCQCRPVEDDEGWRMIPNWRKQLSTLTSGTQYWHDPKIQPGMYTAIGYSVLAQCYGMPIFQAYARKLLEAGGRLPRDWVNMDLQFWLNREMSQHSVALTELRFREVSDRARLSFQKAWDIDVPMQLLIEEQISKWQPPLGDPVDEPESIGRGWQILANLKT